MLSEQFPKYSPKRPAPAKARKPAITQSQSQDLFSDPESAPRVPYKRQKTFEDDVDDFTYSGVNEQKSQTDRFTESCGSIGSTSMKSRPLLSNSDADFYSASPKLKSPAKTQYSKGNSKRKLPKLNIPGFSDSEDDEPELLETNINYTTSKTCGLSENSNDKTLNSTWQKKQCSKSKVDDIYVPDTVFTVPETIITQRSSLQLTEERNKHTATLKPDANNQSIRSRKYIESPKRSRLNDSRSRSNDTKSTKEDSNSHLSILDDLF